MLLYICQGVEKSLKNRTTDKRIGRISGLSIPEEWGERALTVFSLLVIVYTFFEVRYEIAKGKDVMATLNAIFSSVAIFMTFTFGALVILIHGWDWLMFRHKVVQELERRAEAAEERANAAESEIAALKARVAALEAKQEGSPQRDLPPSESE